MRVVEVEKIAKWVKDWKRGDAQAASKLYDTCNKATYNTIIRIVVREEIAQDLLQETFILAFNRISDLKSNKTFPAWLKRIAINQALQYYRKHNPIKEEEWKVENHEETEERDFNSLNQIDISVWLNIIQTLPPKSRLVFQLFYLEDLKHEDIAMRLKISLSTSKSQLRYAKARIKQYLLDNHVH
jgi:RNA polymerase sigma-70 factor (ECF subfamily)